jgi:hypothetical protein
VHVEHDRPFAEGDEMLQQAIVTILWK